ncbi:MAG: MBG domain-containing protein, partial [Nanoarchaeota archaeon]
TNYNPTLVNGTLTINPASLTVTAGNTSRPYGSPNPSLDGLVSASGAMNGDTFTLTASTPATVTTGKGTAPIIPAITGNASTNYNPTLVNGTLTINPASATVGTISTNSIYGEQISQVPTFKSGFVNGEDASVSVTGSTVATNMAPVGEYDTAINLTGQNLESILSNYNLNTNTLAKYTISPRGVSLFANGFTNQYGNVPPTVSFGISNLVGSDTIASFTGSPSISHSVTPFTLAGTNAINIAPGSLTNANYNITNSVGANAVTTTAPITFNILGTNVIYKGPVPDLNVTTSGAKNGEVIVGIAGTTATNGSPAGSYPTFLNSINGPSQFDLRYGPITTNASPVNVAQRGLELRFVNASVPYGDAINLGTNWQVNGLQAGDNTTGSPSISSSAVQGANVGNYPGNISQGSLSAGPNYAVTNIVPGQVSIAPRNASFNIEGFTRAYGDTNPPVNVIASNLYAPDGILASAIPTVGTNSNSGVYTNAFNLNVGPINKLGNYNFAFTNMSDINITNAPLVLNADDKNRLYGETNSILTGGISGLKNNDNIVPVFSTTALQSSQIGEFPINVGISDPDNRAGNYNILTNNSKLTVGKAGLNVSSDNKNMIYGGSVPALTGNAVGLKNGGDGISLGYNTLASPLVNAGDYPVGISVNDPSNRLSNYLVSTNLGNVHVGKAPLLVKGKDVSRLYGDANPPLEVLVTGGVNGNNFVTDATTTATVGSGIGEFAVKPIISGSNTNNYDISLEDGKMTINKAPLPVTVGSGSHVYGSFPQAISASASGARNGDVIVVSPVNPATQISNVGSYTTSATVYGDKITNYAPTITVGNYIVNPATLNAVAEDKLRRSNEGNPALTFNATGFKLGQGNEVFTVPPSLFTTATNGSPAGDYAINISGGNAPNYSLNYSNGNMKVLNNIVQPSFTGISASNGLVNLLGNAFIDNPNGMLVTPMYSTNLNSTNWLPSGVTNIVYPNVVNGTNNSQSFNIGLTNQNSPDRFYKLQILDKKN